MLVADAAVVLPLIALAWSVAVSVTIAATVLTWRVKGLYARRIGLSVLDDLPALTTGVVIGLAPAATAALVVDLDGDPTVLLVVAAALLSGTAFTRTLAYGAIRHLRATGRLSHPTLIVGCGAPTGALIRRIQEHPESGLDLVGMVGNGRGARPGRLPLLGTCQDLSTVIREWGVTDVVIGYGGMSSADLVDVLRTCDRVGAEIYVLPRLFELHGRRLGDDHIWGLPLVRMHRPAQRVSTWRVKRAFDVLVAGIALVLAAPLLLAVAAAVRRELGRGVIFRQTRVGLRGEPFEVMKFRSMRPVVTEGPRTPWTVSEEHIGPVGRFIRRYSLDELPQLFNVLRGDMSLVGPRPERPEFVEQFTAAVPRYVHRHRVPVGMTGLAAVNGLRGDTSIEDRADFDNWYIDNWSLWLDVKILVRTLDAVLKGTGG